MLANIFSTLGIELACKRIVATKLSVNSLSKISDQLARLGQGESIKRFSFALCLLLCAFYIADLFALLFEKYIPSPPVSSLASRVSNTIFSQPGDYDIIASRNLFSSKPPVVAKPKDEIDLDAEPVLSSLPFNLVGTVIFKNTRNSLAAIQNKENSKMYPVRTGDEIEEKIQIFSVEARRVVFINLDSKRKEYIELPEDPSLKISAFPSKKSAPAANTGIAQVEENKFVVKRGELDAQMANFNALITQARAVPNMCGGQMAGFKLMQIQPGSFYEKIGLKVGCVIKSVNGDKISDAAKALSLLQELKTMNSLDLGVNCEPDPCNGKEKVMNYDIQ